ncbi:Hypothetical protein R9X50_00135800 [Acrodontium crateriforme]|uniref:CID domain-containing protein n=1 Tax=Acrodontium crateriforme TaxID=150365 RepID=A0AAQ3M077_9PEZI|nr:Hypothetical protein R9X50_00135800 [Acrodontium crateriforme]
MDPDAFVAALCAPDPAARTLRQEEAYDFARLLFRTLNICTAANVKQCKFFVFQYIVTSDHRTKLFATYLVQLSKHFAPKVSQTPITEPAGIEHEGLQSIFKGLKMQQPPDPTFLRLHILFVVNDVLCFLYSHSSQRNSRLRGHFKAIDEHLKPCIPALVQLAAHGGHVAEITTMTENWRKLSIFPVSEIEALRNKTRAASDTKWSALLATCATSSNRSQHPGQDNSPTWVIPSRHRVVNDPNAPWNELPAANGLYMKRTRGFPLRYQAMPFGGYELANSGREADDALKKDVEWLYSEAIHCFDQHTNSDEVLDVDALGNITWKDPDRPTRNYWGFTLDGVQKRKELGDKFAESAGGYDDVAPQHPGGSAPFDGGAAARGRSLAGATRGGGRGGHGRGYSRGFYHNREGF